MFMLAMSSGCLKSYTIQWSVFDDHVILTLYHIVPKLWGSRPQNKAKTWTTWVWNFETESWDVLRTTTLIVSRAFVHVWCDSVHICLHIGSEITRNLCGCNDTRCTDIQVHHSKLVIWLQKRFAQNIELQKTKLLCSMWYDTFNA